METFGKRLKRLREEKNLTLTQVAKQAGVAITTYRDWEQGRQVKGEPYERLSAILQVSLPYLITGREQEAEKVIREIELLLNKLKQIA